jgi:vancomycin resistance protein YoaR
MVRAARLGAWALVAFVALLLVAGFVFAGSPGRIAHGITVAGVDVGGLTATEARAKLVRTAARYATLPVTFTAGEQRFRIRPTRLAVRADWNAAVAEALGEGDGPIPLRGLERLQARLFGADIEPRARAYEPRLQFELNRMASVIDRPAREAAIELEGMEPLILASRDGARLDRAAAKSAVLDALAGFERSPVALPVAVDEPAVTRETLLPVAADVRTALSAPVRLTYAGGGWTIRPAELAPLLDLPAGGQEDLRVAGPAAERYFRNLAAGVRRAARSADFRVAASGKVRVVPARLGRELDVAATEKGVFKAAVRAQGRAAPLVIASAQPRLTTARARSLRVERRLASYATLYSGTPDRIQNLQRSVLLLDGALVAPGATFSFNRRVGPRTEERGFRPAPVIMNGEYEEGIGGGTSQVATTLFNAVWEAGLRITDRTAHALYISRYPDGRDATVNYPDVDLAFRNDTGRWIVIDASYDESGIAIGLLGAGPVRRVVSETGPLEETANPPVKRRPDPTLYVGERAVIEDGEPAREIRVTRTVYQGGEVLYDETWYTAYRAEPKLVRFGTKAKPVEEEPPPPTPDEEKPKKDDPAAPGG